MVKVSVIIPIYNMGLYLEECLNSVMMQTLKEIEVICINDGSTDNSLEILQEFTGKYNNVIIVNQENCGVAKSRNNGINIAMGEFVAFMDPDDYYPSNDILEFLYNSARKHEVNICGGSLSSLKNGNIIKEYPGWGKNYTFANNDKVKYSQYQFHYGFTRFIYSLEFLKKNNLYFPLYVRYEDPPFFVRAMISASEFYAVRKITYCYREGHKKVILTQKKTTDYAKGVLELLNISRKQEFSKLHAIIIESMFHDLFPALYKYVSEGNLHLQELLYEINNAININLLQEKNAVLKNYFLLKPNEVLDYIRERKKFFINTLSKYKEIIIYGAGNVGKVTIEYLNSINEKKVICFAVSDIAKNDNNFYGIPVKDISKITKYKESALVLIATSTNLHNEMKQTLERLEFRNIMLIYSYEFLFFTII